MKSSNLSGEVQISVKKVRKFGAGGKIVFQMWASLPGICVIAGALAGKILTNSPARLFFENAYFQPMVLREGWKSLREQM